MSPSLLLMGVSATALISTYIAKRYHAVLYSYKSVPKEVESGAEKFIADNNLDGRGISFHFQNSDETLSPMYVAKNLIDMYKPNMYIVKASVMRGEGVYYVHQCYYNPHDHYSIGVGYFLINSKGQIIDSKNLKTYKELKRYDLDTNISYYKAFDMAMRMTPDEDELVWRGDGRFFYYEEGREPRICYKFRFKSGRYIYLDANTGEIVEKSEF